ncbi:MAG TPA: Ig-like domain-containing protein [Polyangia bacterium]|nr:Ig-like domain-containing protein [Polyangia bacterium]
MFGAVCLLLTAAQPSPYRPTPPRLPPQAVDPSQSQTRSPLAPQAPQILYLNFDGAMLTPGAGCSNASINCSFILGAGPVNYPAFGGSMDTKQQVIDLVKTYYAPFNVQIVLTRPAAAPYAMAMVGGGPETIGGSRGIAGVGPLDCGNMNPNDISFTFSNVFGNDPHNIAVTIAQESAHAFGLGHTNDRTDIMYPSVSGVESAFQNRQNRIYDLPGSGSSDCGGTGYQNSYQLMLTNVGSGVPDTTPPQIGFNSPEDGATLPSAFTVDFNASDNVVVAQVTLLANSQQVAMATRYPWRLIVPAGAIAPGPTKLKGVAQDAAGNTAETAEISVTVKAIGQTPGDLGTACMADMECNGSGFCANDSGHRYCSRLCTPTIICPSGFDCISDAQFSQHCAPSPKDEGCSALPSGARRSNRAVPLALLALAGLAFVVSRRRGRR